MKARPSSEELVAIVVALRLASPSAPLASERAPSQWARAVRRESVRAYVPQTWRD